MKVGPMIAQVKPEDIISSLNETMRQDLIVG